MPYMQFILVEFSKGITPSTHIINNKFLNYLKPTKLIIASKQQGEMVNDIKNDPQER